MLSILAIIPLALILILMVWFHWSASRAGIAGYLIALAIAFLFFGAGPVLLGYAHARALLFTLDVLYIIWAAFLFYRVTEEAGVIRLIGQALPRLTTDPGMQVLIIAFCFASFLQGVGGFGVPVAVTAPLLIGLGIGPGLAVVLASIGTTWSAAFGSLGSAFQALVTASGLAGEQLAIPAAVVMAPAAAVAGLLVCHALGGWHEVRRLLSPAILLGVVMSVAQYAAASVRLWNLASFIGGAAGLLVAFPLARKWNGRDRWEGQPANPGGNPRHLAVALSGYAILVGVSLVLQLIPGVRAWLSQIVIAVPFPEVSTALGYTTPAGFGRRIVPFVHPGASLIYSAFGVFLLFKAAGFYQSGAVGRIARATARQLLPSSVGIAAMVTMSVIMENSGMTDLLAGLLAGSVGAAFPIVAPWIGALGAFITGSNTNSNVVFTSLQLKTARMLNLDVFRILGAQTTGGSIGSSLAPAKVIVGASTAGMGGREGEILRHMAIYILILLLVVSLATAILVWGL